ncbi:MAG: response regulator transcription factor [Bacteroidales bacterium]|nr:response regulator transcription factor [Bacteroidales bacterium]
MRQKKKIRILMVEDHPLYRVGLRMALSYSGLDCVVKAEAENVSQAEKYIQEYPGEIDLILLDYYLPDGTGLDVLKTSKQACPKVKVLLVSGEDENPNLLILMKAGLNGFTSKDVTPQGLATIIKSVFMGEDVFDKEPFNAQKDDNKTDALTEREIEIIRLCALGRTPKQVADELFISIRTVESHKYKIFQKIGCGTTTEMVNYAFLNGLV